MDKRVKLVDEVRGAHRGREVRTTDGEIAFARRFELADSVASEQGANTDLLSRMPRSRLALHARPGR